MDNAALEQLGLTKNESKVYLALLELGSTPAGALIKRVGMHRAAVYDLVDILIDKGLVSYVVMANRKYFEAQDPDRLFAYLDTQKQDLLLKEEQLKKILPELHLKRKLAHELQEATVYKGKKGLKSIFEHILKEKKPWFVFGATGQFKELFHAYFIHFHQRRAKLKIPLKILFEEHLRVEKRARELLLAEIKYLPQSYLTPSTTYIFGDNVAIVMWSAEPMAFLLRSKQVAESYKTFFDLLWKIAVK